MHNLSVGRAEVTALDQCGASERDGECLPFPLRNIVSITATRQGFPSARCRAALTGPGRDAKPSFPQEGMAGIAMVTLWCFPLVSIGELGCNRGRWHANALDGSFHGR